MLSNLGEKEDSKEDREASKGQRREDELNNP